MTTTPTLDLDGLERIARAATHFRWRIGSYGEIDVAVMASLPYPEGGTVACMICVVERVPGDHVAAPDLVTKEADAAHIAAFDPPTVLAMIARIRAGTKEKV